ncbi:sirohydrochlorin cobaltochelatase [Desulfatirhabdium butyrativorans]|uniref:sirohydrochlorin cobaltochelatase n=1 Tax=Desulfatirhabdium butyrativorans TaxID=340467 RepID=UPI000428AED7|nr:sirohydrochlorin cobaltochelatase [Desulfatirhabdium butyrativorans]
MTIPIVLAAFGTTSRAKDTYALVEVQVKNRFPLAPLRWAVTSRKVKAAAAAAEAAEGAPRAGGHRLQQSPGEVLEELHAAGHRWAVVQSLHVVGGHEFDRLIAEIRQAPIRTSVGLPLLTSYGDYWKVAQALRPLIGAAPCDEAVVLVGHGTDHPAWAAYLALEAICRQRFGPQVFVGLIEGKPGRTATVHAVRKAGYRQARLVPFTLVAGVHFEEDIMGEGGWASAFADAGIDIRVESSGLGRNGRIIDVFLDHIADAADVIPDDGDRSCKAV